MTSTIRRIVRSIAVSGAAGVALLSGAATAGAMDANTYADDSHRTAVVQLAADSPGTSGIDDRLNQQPQQPAPQAPNGQTPQQPGVGQDVQTQAGAGTIAVGSAAALLLGIIIVVLVRKSGLKASHAFACIAFGVLVAGTFVGALVTQLASSGATAFGGIFAGL